MGCVSVSSTSIISKSISLFLFLIATTKCGMHRALTSVQPLAALFKGVRERRPWWRMAARASWDCNGMGWSLKPTATGSETVFVPCRGEPTRAMLKDSGSWKECGWMEVEPLVLLQWKLASANNMLHVLYQCYRYIKCYTSTRDSEYWWGDKAKRGEN